MLFSASSHLFKKVTLNAYPVSENISLFDTQFKTVRGLITVEISPATKPFLVQDATFIMFAIFSFPFGLLKLLFFAKMISISLSKVK